MAIRTMVSPNRNRHTHFHPMTRQGSLYNLTFDEVQTQLGNIGKPVNNMNLDELVKNVLSVEEGQFMQNLNQSSSSSPPSSFLLGNFNLNGTLSKKTVDEVWKEIVHHQQNVNNGANNNPPVEQQLGETTLEDFLIRAGVMRVGNDQNASVINSQPLMGLDPMVVVSQQADWLQLQMAAVEQHQQQLRSVLDSNYHVSETVFENSIEDVNSYHSENQLSMPVAMPVVAATSSESQAVVERKSHFPDEMMEKTIERRQKRMIKNRESAARSRARKQAYTNQLEHEVFQLRKTNNWLKKQKQDVELLLSSNPTPVPKYQLRRTSTAPF